MTRDICRAMVYLDKSMKQGGGASLDESDVVDLNVHKVKGVQLYAKTPANMMAMPQGQIESNSEKNLREKNLMSVSNSDQQKSDRIISKTTKGLGSSQLSQRRIQNPHQEIPNDDILHDSESKSARSNKSGGIEYQDSNLHSPDQTGESRKLRSTTLNLSPPKIVDRPPSRAQN